MANDGGRILIVRGGAIGDFILTLPVFAALRQRFPHVHLETLAYPHIAQLALAGGLVDKIQPIEAQALAGFFARNGTLDPTLSDYFSSFDLILSFLYDPDFIFQTNVARSSGAQFIAGPHRPNESEEFHAAEVFLKPLERLAIFDADPLPRLQIESDNGFSLAPGKWIALHPGSGSELKNWPEENWEQLVTRLVESTDYFFLLVGGEAESHRLNRLSARVPSERLKVAMHLPLVDLAKSLKHCVAFIGHDSGISHLASAMGLQGLVLWGPTQPRIWRPLHERMTILREEAGLEALRVDQVWDALKFI